LKDNFQDLISQEQTKEQKSPLQQRSNFYSLAISKFQDLIDFPLKKYPHILVETTREVIICCLMMSLNFTPTKPFLVI
jgi:hypothetical protein